VIIFTFISGFLSELSADERRLCESDVEVRDRKVVLAHLRAKVKSLLHREKGLLGKFSLLRVYLLRFRHRQVILHKFAFCTEIQKGHVIDVLTEK